MQFVEGQEVLERDIGPEVVDADLLGELPGDGVTEGHILQAEVGEVQEVAVAGRIVHARITRTGIEGIVVVVHELAVLPVLIPEVLRHGERHIAVGTRHRDGGFIGAPHVTLADALEEDGQVEAFPAHVGAEAVLVTRRGVTDHREVAVVVDRVGTRSDDTVAVEVHVADVTVAELGVGAAAGDAVLERIVRAVGELVVRVGVGVAVGVDVARIVGGHHDQVAVGIVREVVVGEQAVGLVAPDLTVNLAVVPAADAGSGAVFGDDGLRVGEGGVDREREAVVEDMAPVEGDFPAAGAQGTVVALRRSRTEVVTDTFGAHDHVLGVTLVPVEGHAERVEQAEVDTEVKRDDVLPGQAGGNSGRRVIVHKVGTVGSHPGCRTAAHRRDIEGVAHGLVTDGTPGSAELHRGEDVFDAFHPGLFGHTPAGGEGRIPSPAELGRELGGTVVADVGLEEIFFLVVVVQAAEETEGRVPVEGTAGGLRTGCQVELRVLGIHQHGLLAPDAVVDVRQRLHTEHEVEVVLRKVERIGGVHVPGLALGGEVVTVDVVRR